MMNSGYIGAGTAKNHQQRASYSNSNNNAHQRYRGPSNISNIVDDEANIQKQLRSLQLENEKMRELIEELKQANQLYLSERDLLEGKLKTKIAQVQKFASQCQINSKKAFMFEQVTADYRNGLIDLESGDNNGAPSDSAIHHLRQRV